MATEDVQAVLRKASSDDAFRIALAKDFDKTITTHHLELSADEAKHLKAVNWKNALPSAKAAAAGTWVHIYKSSLTERHINE
jgi:hypothetical protein